MTCAGPRWPPGCKAIYGTVDNVDAFVGMLRRAARARLELGETQLAIWTRQFRRCATATGSTSATTRAELHPQHVRHRLPADAGADHRDEHRRDAAADLARQRFLVADDDLPATTCTVLHHHPARRRRVQRQDLDHQHHPPTIDGWTARFRARPGPGPADRGRRLLHPERDGTNGRDSHRDGHSSPDSTSVIQPHTSEDHSGTKSGLRWPPQRDTAQFHTQQQAVRVQPH